MRNNTFLFAAMALAGFASAVSNATNATTTCHSYVIVSTRGTSEAQGRSSAFGTMINTTLNIIPNGTEYDTVYPASQANDSVPLGIADVVRYVKSGVQACPQQKYILLGYSQGAGVTLRALQQLPVDSVYGQAIVGVLFVGNPSHKAFRNSNADELGGKRSDAYFGSLYTGQDSALPETWYSSDKVLDICFYNDVVCMATLTSLLNAFVNHLLYGVTPSVQEQGSNYMINKLYLAGLSPINASTFGVS